MVETKPGLKFIHHEEGDIVERTVGRIGAIPFHFLRATYGSMGKDIPKERIEYLEEKFKDVNWQGDIEVHLNHAPVMHELKRLFSPERKHSLFTRVLFGVPTTLVSGLAAKLAQWNFYNPYSETLRLFNENKYVDVAVGTVAETIDTQKNKVLKEAFAFANSIPFVLNTLLYTKANLDALKKFKGEEYDEARTVISSGMGSEVIVDALGVLATLKGLEGFESIAPYVPDLGIGESVLLGAGVTGGLYAGNKIINELNDPHVYFDESRPIESKGKNKDRERWGNLGLSPEIQLNQLAA